MRGLGDEGLGQIRYRVGEEGEHDVGLPSMPCRHAERWTSGGASWTARSPSEFASRRRYANSWVGRERSASRDTKLSTYIHLIDGGLGDGEALNP